MAYSFVKASFISFDLRKILSILLENKLLVSSINLKPLKPTIQLPHPKNMVNSYVFSRYWVLDIEKKKRASKKIPSAAHLLSERAEELRSKVYLLQMFNFETSF